MVGDYFTKPLQGSLFRKMRSIIMGDVDAKEPSTAAGKVDNGAGKAGTTKGPTMGAQECVEASVTEKSDCSQGESPRTYSEVVRGKG